MALAPTDILDPINDTASGACTAQAVSRHGGERLRYNVGGRLRHLNHIRQRGAYTTPEPALLPPLHRREEVSHGAYAMTKLT